MNTPLGRLSHRIRLAGVAALLLAAATPALAQNVVLNPATVQGAIGVTGFTISTAYVSASWTDTSTNPPTTYSASTSTTNGSYSLIVNVPQGSTPTYTVYAYAYFNGSNQQFSFNPQTVNPDPATPQTLDFVVDPGVIQGTVTVSGGTLNYLYIYAGSNNAYFPTNTYSMVVMPGTGINVYGYGYGQYGGGQLSPSSQTVDVAPGQVVTGIDWTITLPPQPATGSIAGTISISGNVTPNSVSVSASGPQYYSVNASGPYSIPDVFAGSYYVYGSASFANGAYLSFPDSMFSPSRSAVVTGGGTATVDVAGTESFLNGVVTLVGTNTLADTNSASFNATGIYSTNSYGGSGGQSLPNSGAYSLVLTEGSWAPNALYLTFYHPDPANYLYEQLYFYDSDQYNNPVALAAGETATRNLAYATGQITVNFQALGNATFSNPQLYFTCSHLDPTTHQTLWSYYGYAYNQILSGVSTGGVTFAGMSGDCSIQASAYVNGSNYVTFGTLNATLVAGVVQVIDIGGPSLTVTSPGANDLLATASVTVTGIADDEVIDVDTITVNGVAAAFAPTGAGGHPHQVSFTVSVPLSLGANTLATVVTAKPTDVPAKSASDTRTVFYDPGPLTLNWTPADGSSTSASTAAVTGTASDPAGITDVLVNGASVVVTPTGNTGEVSFSTTVSLVDGDNAIQVTAKGLASQSLTQIHHVMKVTQAQAIVSASGGSFAYDATPHAGSGSATGGHGQSLPVTLTYSGTGSTSYGPTAAAPTNAGTYQVVAHADGDADTLAGDSAPAALTINKANASIIVGGYHVPYDGSSHTAIGSAKGVLLENLAGLDLSATVHTAVGSYDDPWTFTDVTGNYNDASGTVHSDIEAVTLTYHVCGDGGPYGPKKSGSTIPIKLQVCDQTGASVSNVVVHATGIQLASGTQNGTLQDSGNANPGMNFRLVGPPSSYMFNLQTNGFASGTYNLLFTIGSDPTVNAVAFQVK